MLLLLTHHNVVVLGGCGELRLVVVPLRLGKLSFGFPVAADEEAVQDEEEQRDQVEVEGPLGRAQGILACIDVYRALAPDGTACCAVFWHFLLVEEVSFYFVLVHPIIVGSSSFRVEKSRNVAGHGPRIVVSFERNRIAYMIFVEGHGKMLEG